jgi:hypothetical protein
MCKQHQRLHETHQALITSLNPHAKPAFSGKPAKAILIFLIAVEKAEALNETKI